jgi:hypothetical protein
MAYFIIPIIVLIISTIVIQKYAKPLYSAVNALLNVLKVFQL